MSEKTERKESSGRSLIIRRIHPTSYYYQDCDAERTGLR
jgi:hypothetical protein